LGHYKLKFLSYKAEFLRTEWGRHFDFYIPRSAQTHNEYIQVAAEMGAFGLAALAWVLGSILWGLRRMLRTGRDSDDYDQSRRLLQLGLYGGVVAFLVDSGFDFPLHRPASALALVVFVGLLHSRPLSAGRGVTRSTSLAAPTLKLGRRGIAALAVSILLVTVTVSLLAYRDFRADLYLEAGRLDLQAGRLLAAKAKLERSVQWAFQPATALFHLGEVYGELGNHQQAVEALERSLQGRVTEGAYLLLAQVYLQAGMDEQAWESVQRLLATEPHPIQKAPARYLKAELFRRKGDLNLALLQLRILIRDQPDFVEAYVLMAKIHQQQREFKEARELYLRGLEVASDLLERKGRLLREELTGAGLAVVEWKQLLRQIDELERQIEEIREALRGLALPIRTSKGRI
jgi:tetratricopeptide (TPR) repeat protein